MRLKFSNSQIQELIKEPKELPRDFMDQMMLRPKIGHKEQELDVVGEQGHQFRVMLRQSNENTLDFSAILMYIDPASNTVFRLRRYNGKSHLHSNFLENNLKFYDFHIHQATEQYQHSGLREDTFAEATTRFSDLRSAIDCLIEDCGFILPLGHPMNLF